MYKRQPEKLSLSEHLQMVRYGMLLNQVHPFDCSPLVVQAPVTGKASVAEGALAIPQGRGFAPLQNEAPAVLANPHAVVIYWGAPDIDSRVDAKVRQLLALDFIKSTLLESVSYTHLLYRIMWLGRTKRNGGCCFATSTICSRSRPSAREIARSSGFTTGLSLIHI